MNPLLPLETLIPLMLVLGIGLVFAAIRAAKPLPNPWRRMSPLLRLATLLCMGLILLNPGEFRPLDADRDGNAWILLDRSASMTFPEHSGGPDRFQTALDRIRDLPDEPRTRVRVLPFADTLDREVTPDDLATLRAAGTGTDFVTALRGALDRAQSHPDPARGLFILTDGIPTVPVNEELDALAVRARASRIPVSAVRIGQPLETPELLLRPHQDLLTVTAGSERAVRGTVVSRHHPALRLPLRLLDADGETVAETLLDLPENSEVPFTLHTPELPSGVHAYRLELDPADPEEDEAARHNIHVNAVDIHLRVLLLEGTPHWDSKFLAQWFRSRKGVELTTLHRLSEERYFLVGPEGAAPQAVDRARLPGEDNDFRDFDLILLGRGMEPFFNPAATASLHRFVRDHGGVLIATRGRPVTASRPALESLFPVEWREARSDEHLARPTRTGANLGLFGDLLPGPASDVWQQLPPLRGLRDLRLTDGLASILLEARPPRDGDAWPVMVRRPFGNGQILLLNGEGMWHWDFQADAVTDDRWYGDFWTQVLLWTTHASRFQPGRTWSLDWDTRDPAPGQDIRLLAERRLPRETPAERPPRVRIESDDHPPQEAVLYPSGPDGELAGRWTPPAPGLFLLTVLEGDEEAAADSPRPLRIPAPPGETDQTDPQDEPLRSFVEQSGGQWLTASEAALAFAPLQDDPAAPAGEDIWHPRWSRAGLLILFIALPALEWGLRRRKGLI